MTIAPPPLDSAMRRAGRRPARAVMSLWRAAAHSRPLAYFVFLVLYAIPTLTLAHRKLLWDDEFYTLYLSSTGSWAELMRAMSTGADQHPPSFYWLTHLLLSTFGASTIVFRLTAIAGFAVFCLSLYEIAGRILDREWGFCAMLLPLATPHLFYASESRGYGLQLGFAGAALLAWMLAAEGRRRWLTLPLLAAALCGVVGSHYYGALMVAPLAIGELARTVSRRRIDLPVWLAFGGAAIPIIAFAPLIAGSRAYSEHFWAVPRWSAMWMWYPDALGYAVALPLAISVIVALYPHDGVSGSRLRPWHAAAFLALALLPVMTMVVAKLVTHAFTARYAIAAMAGLCPLMIAGLARIARPIPWAPAAVSLAILLCFVRVAVGFHKTQRAELAKVREGASILRGAGDGEIVAGDSTSLHRFSFYARRDFAHRVTYLADPDASVRHLGFDTIDRCLLAMRPWFPLNVRPAGEWLAAHPSFVLWGYVGPWGSVTTDLAERGANMRLERVQPGFLLFRVDGVPSAPAESPARSPMLYERLPKDGPPLCRQYFSASSCPAID